jgi:hypothetical protein
MDAIELELDPNDDELATAFAGVVRDLALERRDLTDPLTAIEADRRLGQRCPGGSVEFSAPNLLAPPIWSVQREAMPGSGTGAAVAARR